MYMLSQILKIKEFIYFKNKKKFNNHYFNIKFYFIIADFYSNTMDDGLFQCDDSGR